MVAVNIGSKDKSAVYYDPPIKEVVQPVRHLLETYAKIPPEDVIPRLNEMVCAPSPLLSGLLLLCSSPFLLGTYISLTHARGGGGGGFSATVCGMYTRGRAWGSSGSWTSR